MPTVFEHYIVGVLLGLVSIVPVAVGSRRLRARLLPGFSGAPARVAEAVLAASLLVIALELVGIIGAFTQFGATAACVALGLSAWLGAGRLPSSEGEQRTPLSTTGRRRAPTLVAVAAVAAVSAPWTGWTVYAYGHGMYTADTLWYHLPVAARFVQTGSILHLHYVDSNPVTPFYPSNAELFHAFGLLVFHSDLLSPVVNLGWAALALVAGWSIGRPAGREPHCLVAVALLLATPALIDTQPGGAYNDVVCIALLLCCVAILINGGVRLRPSALASMAAGLALGTKFTMIAPALALAVGVVAISGRGTRARQAAIWAGGLLLLGGYWYIRNAASVGNPLPALAVHLGPLSLPSPHVSTPTFTVGQYLTNLHVIRAYYAPGLQTALGPASWAIIGFAVAASLGAVVSGRDRVQRMLGCVAVASAGAYLVTPQFLGAPGAPFFFVFNVRYAAAPIVLGLVLLPLHPWFARRIQAALWLGTAAAVLLATEIDPGVWPTGLGLKAFGPALSGTPALVGGLVGIAVLALGAAWASGGSRLRPLRQAFSARPAIAARAAAAAALAAVLVAGWGVANTYAHRRYAAQRGLTRWAHHTRIGLAGFVLQYPLYGADSSNYVQYLGAPEPHGGFGPISSCREWRDVVDRGRYDWLVLIPASSPYVAWTLGSPAATLVLRQPGPAGAPGESSVLFRLKGALDRSGCKAQPKRAG